jgi:FecR protein
MKPAACPRLFEVEAARDGRLGSAELASFRLHAARCADCSREAEALDALAAALGAMPTRPADDLHARRERTRLLTEFNRGVVAPAPQRRRAAWVAAALLVTIGVVLLRVLHRASPSLASNAVVRAIGPTVWSESVQGSVDRIRLEQGALWIHVDHSTEPARRLVVLLPDGELEDIGTTFTVQAAGERTTRVAVEDGRVVLRLRGHLGVEIGRGETWTPVGQPKAAACASASPEADPSSGVSAARPARSATPRASEPRSDPLIDFRAAMAAFNAGDNAAAAAAFARFVADHPRDPQAQDAAYLRVIALQRAGAGNAMKQAAADYLERYPNGFRRTEVQKLAK